MGCSSGDPGRAPFERNKTSKNGSFMLERRGGGGFVEPVMSNLSCSVGIFNTRRLMNETHCVVSH